MDADGEEDRPGLGQPAQRLPFGANVERLAGVVGRDMGKGLFRRFADPAQGIGRRDEPVAAAVDRTRLELAHEPIDRTGQLLGIVVDRPVHRRQRQAELAARLPVRRKGDRRADEPVNLLVTVPGKQAHILPVRPPRAFEPAGDSEHRSQLLARCFGLGRELHGSREPVERRLAGCEVRIRLEPLALLELGQPDPQRPTAASEREQRIDREAELHSAASASGGMLWPRRRSRSAAHSTTLEPGP